MSVARKLHVGVVAVFSVIIFGVLAETAIIFFQIPKIPENKEIVLTAWFAIIMFVLAIVMAIWTTRAKKK